MRKELSDRGLMWAIAVGFTGLGLVGLDPLLRGASVDWLYPVALAIGVIAFVVLAVKRPEA